MAREYHLPLFHPRLVRARVAALDPALCARHSETIGGWIAHLKSGALDETKEVSLRGGFLERIFGAVLGYATMANARDGQWELVAEKTMHSGGSADGAVGFFSRNKSHVVAPIELKGATQFLEHAKKVQAERLKAGTKILDVYKKSIDYLPELRSLLQQNAEDLSRPLQAVTPVKKKRNPKAT